MTRIATSTWSLHRTLGASMYQWPDPKGEPVLEGTGQGDLTLLELPAAACRTRHRPVGDLPLPLPEARR